MGRQRRCPCTQGRRLTLLSRGWICQSPSTTDLVLAIQFRVPDHPRPRPPAPRRAHLLWMGPSGPQRAPAIDVGERLSNRGGGNYGHGTVPCGSENLRPPDRQSKLGKMWFLYFGVHANPIEQDVQDAAQAFRAHDCDGIIAIGGGSPLDVGKATPRRVAASPMRTAWSRREHRIAAFPLDFATAGRRSPAWREREGTAAGIRRK